ncbi:MAG: acyloxyacyl hydrolase [Chitinophagales bacterium]|nr:acyloxyacyl hydrolase [Chitinophagaceae bacterium]MCB9065259.1 acyloxyacyl hydrolase [Chitinophagales bacterium]
MRILFVCTLLFWSFSVTAQEWLAGYGVEVNPIFGKVLKHNYIFPPVPKSSYAIDINILKQTNGNKEWQARRKYPLFGLGITYTNYGIDSIYGKCIGLYPVWEFPIIKGEKLEWTCRFGYGIGYISKTYERYPSFDTVNNLIGSHVNNFTMFTTQLRYKLNHHVHIHAGFNYSHVSNGSFKLPNLGVNMYGGHIGVRYFPVTDDPPKALKNFSQLSLPNRWMVQARVGMGLVEYGNTDGPQYPVYTATLYGSWRYGSRNKILAGIDYSYYKSVESFLRLNEIEIGEERANSWEGAIFVGHEFIIGRVGVLAHLGIPFKRTVTNEDLTIQKLGYCYYIIQQEKGILKELTANCFIKSNNLEASHLEFSLGVGF